MPVHNLSKEKATISPWLKKEICFDDWYKLWTTSGTTTSAPKRILLDKKITENAFNFFKRKLEFKYYNIK